MRNGSVCISFAIAVAFVPVSMAQTDVLGQCGSFLSNATVPPTWPPLQVVHAIALKNGKVLLVDTDSYSALQRPVYLWNPADNAMTTIADPPIDVESDPQCPINLFCSGHAHLDDQRVAFFGGGHGYADSHAHTVIFNPAALDAVPPTYPWTLVADMLPVGTMQAAKRWYPSATVLASGAILVTGGGDQANNPPVTDGDNFAVLLNNAQSAYSLVNANQYLPWYPLTHLLTDGTVFSAGSHYYNAVYDPGSPPGSNPIPSIRLNTATPTWTQVTTSAIKGGSSVMYRPNMVMKAGGGLSGTQSSPCDGTTTVTARAMTIDLNQARL